MAKPRVFVSSTFYDLRQVREDLERFITGLGYEAVLHETGAIPYGKDGPPEASIYREIGTCDILVCVIGGRYGTDSQEQPGLSITQTELLTAIKSHVHASIFIEQTVYAEYNTYLLNKTTADINYCAVDDPRIYEFIESVHQLGNNNPIAPFRTAADIIEFLKAQWAGLFQRFLQDQNRIEEFKALNEIKTVAGTLDQLVKFLTEERRGSDQAIQQILHTNHPAFYRFQELTNTPYRVFFTDEEELDRWLRAIGWIPFSKEAYDPGSHKEWFRRGRQAPSHYIKLTEAIFDEDGKLKNYAENEWNDNWLELASLDEEEEPSPSPRATRRASSRTANGNNNP